MNRVRIAGAILTLPGLLALFLPFAYKTSPISVVLNPSDLFFLGIIRYAGPAFLAFVIVIWMLRRLFGTRMSTIEIILAHFLSSLSMLSILTLTFNFDAKNIDTSAMLALGATWVLALLNILFLVRNIREHWNAEDVAEAFLLAGYLPNAVCCLIAFLPHLQSGGFAVALACVAYGTSIVLLVRRSGKEAALSSQRKLDA
jgi:hypothetical protein